MATRRPPPSQPSLADHSATSDIGVLLHAIVDSVPIWYRAGTGPARHDIELPGGAWPFYSYLPQGAMHDRLLATINAEITGWAENMPSPPTRSYLASVREKIALHWLRFHEPGVAWNKLLSYLDLLAYRTYEHRPVTRNLLVREQPRGEVDIDELDLQLALDPLAGSSQTYLQIDYDGRYAGYDEVLYGAIEDSEGNKMHPEFLQPLQSQLGPLDYSLHLTPRREIIVLGFEGMIAARRRGGWHVYDARRMKQDVYASFEDQRLSVNLFGITLDLSYAGNGALLVYDPRRRVLEHILNAEQAIIGGPTPRGDRARRLLASAVRPIIMTEAGMARRKKWLFLEIASLDGAVLFDDHGVLAFGAMIESHPGVKGYLGARTTAMHSAYLWGGRPIMVSADGEVVIPFRSKGPDGECDAELHFL